jgi:hypothetical protein
MKFKAEIGLLLTAIALFATSAFLYSYSYQTISEGLALASAPEYPYQSYAFSLVGFGSLLMLIASLSYLKRSKPPCVNIHTVELSEELR